jgi:hypothetical protein
MFGTVVDNATPYLEKGRHFALVIGDKYSKGEWIPLGSYCIELRGKINQKELWRSICLN